MGNDYNMGIICSWYNSIGVLTMKVDTKSGNIFYNFLGNFCSKIYYEIYK